MREYIKPPTLSTSFSESGKTAKKRFENILNIKTKKTGVIAFVVVICIVLSAGALVACNTGISIIGGSDGPTSIYVSSDMEKQIKDLYGSKIKYVGDNSGVAKIVELLPFAEGVKPQNIELQTDNEPYGVTLNYIIDDYDKAVIDNTVKADGFYKNAMLMLCLIDNADSITVNIKDEMQYKGAMYSYTYLRTDFDNIFHKPLREFSKDYDSFKTFFTSVSVDTESRAISPVEVVGLHFEAMQPNNMDAWLSTMTEEKRKGFTDPDLFEYLKSIKINQIYELYGDELEGRLKTILNSEKAKELNLSSDNIAIIHANFTVESDTTQSPFNGTFEWDYILIKENNNSPWLIQEWGAGNGGI
jgi:hypothetical protein